MLIESNRIATAEFERGTGWSIRPEGACRGDICVPLKSAPSGDDIDVASIDVSYIASELGMSIARHSEGLAAIGPASHGGRALSTATAPELILPDFDGNPFDLRSLLGQKVVLVAWSPY